jgi:hypothetical protein
MEKNNYIIIVAVILIIAAFFAGDIFGVSMQKKTTINQSEQTSALIKTLSSDAVPSIVAYGEVSEINDKNITLSFNGDTITAKIKDDANFYSYAGNSSSPSKLSFDQIQVGDMLNISIKLTADGQLEGESVINFTR